MPLYGTSETGFFIGFINRMRRAKAAYARSPPLLPRCASLFRHQSPLMACRCHYVPGYLLLPPFLFCFCYLSLK